MKKYLFFLFTISVTVCMACFDNTGPAPLPPSSPQKDLLVSLRDTTLNINGRMTDIQYPSGKMKGCILCLPGWNFSRTDLCEKSSFCTSAKAQGYALLLPEMGKSIYASMLYPQTRSDWTRYPELPFVLDTLIPFLQKTTGLLKKNGNNFLYGISTGARGVAMIAMHTGNLFKAGAALSGDYDPLRMPNDNLLKGFYGELKTYEERWKNDDPCLHAGDFKTALYLAHGGKDKVVPTEQTQLFYDTLFSLKEHPEVQLHISENAEHNYDFWGGETDAVLKFFARFLK